MKLSQQQLIYIFIVLLVFILFCYIFPLNNTLERLEGFSNIRTGVQSVSENQLDQNLPLCQYMIMSACDAAYDGDKMTEKQLNKVIKTGCRFLDFQVFCDDQTLGANRPYIGFSTDPDFVKITGIESKAAKRLTLKKVLTTIASSCFGTVAPNSDDPVFIHLRIKSFNSNIYDMIAQDIKSTLESRLFSDQTHKAVPVNKDTLLKSIMGKIIIVVDRSFNDTYLKLTSCFNESSQCVKLERLVNIETSGDFWHFLDFDPNLDISCITRGGTSSPIVDEKSSSMGVVIKSKSSFDLNLISPSIDANPDVLSACTYIANLGCQTLMFRFYISDAGLNWYKGLFHVYKTAFIPMGYAVSACSTHSKAPNRVLF